MMKDFTPKPGEFMHTESQKSVFVNIYSPIVGVVLSTDELPSGFLENGKGIGIKHTSHDHIYAHMDGKVTKLDLKEKTIHITDSAFGITVSFRVGVDDSSITIIPHTEVGKTVKQGDLIFDISKPKGGSIISALLVLNDEKILDKDIKLFCKIGEEVKEKVFLMSIVQKEVQ